MDVLQFFEGSVRLMNVFTIHGEEKLQFMNVIIYGSFFFTIYERKYTTYKEVYILT